MAITVSHNFVSVKPDGVDATLVQPSAWNDNHAVSGTIDVANGGTGANNAADARTNLGLGTIATQAANSVSITGGSISGVSITSLDSNTVFQDNADPSKQMQLQLSSLQTGHTTVVTLPNENTDYAYTLVTEETAQTLENKTLTAPAINGGTIDGTVIGGSSAAAITGTTITANTSLALTGVADTATAATHYFVEIATDGLVRPKTLANAQAELVTTATVNAAAATTVGALSSGSITSGFGAIDIGTDALTAGAGTFSGNVALGDAEATDTHAIKGATTLLANSASAAFTVTQTGAGNAFVVEDSASTDSTPFVINASGSVGFGATPSAIISVLSSKQITGGTTAYGIYTDSSVDGSTVTAAAAYFQTSVNTSAGSTISLSHYAAAQGTLTGSVTSQFGVRVGGTLIGASNNYGFYSDIAAAPNRWNFFAAGTAANYFAGQTLIGSPTAATNSPRLDVVSNYGICISDVATDATNKNIRYSGRHYTNSEEAVALITGSMQTASNFVNIGGGTGVFNAATSVSIYTAANNTTLTGTANLVVDSGGQTTVKALATNIVTNTAATYTVLTTDHTIIQTTAASTYTLPAAASFTGRRLHLLTQFAGTVISASSNVVPIAGGAAGTAILAATAGKFAILQSNGTNWIVIAAN